MKKILFAALAALAITSCSQNEEIEAPSQKAEIKFNTAVSKNSRAATIQTANFTSFTAYAYNYDKSTWATATTLNPFFSNITYGFSNSTWTGKNTDNKEQTFYWPESDHVSFFAYSGDVVEWSDAKVENATITAPQFTYTVEDDVTQQKDIIVAELMNKQKSQNATPTEDITLTFNHALTKIGFKIKGEGANVNYTVSSIRINAKNKGVYTYKATGTTTTDLGEWNIANDATSKSYTITLATDDQAITGGATAKDLCTNNDYIAMLIPQPLADLSIDVYYIAKQGNVTLRDKTTTPETIALKGTAATWESGKYIVYTLGLKGGEQMNVKGSYSDLWDAPTSEDLDTAN